MAERYPFSAEQQAAWEAWVASRPPIIRDLARRFPPNRLYRMASSRRRCYLIGYAEDGTLSLAVTGQYNRVIFSRNVFGVAPEELTECELPAPGEDVGDTAAEAGYSETDIREILIPRPRRKAKKDENDGTTV